MWAARARQEAEWERTSYLGVWLLQPWSKERIHPGDLNPYRRKVVRRGPRNEAERQAESVAGWELLGRGLGDRGKPLQ